MKMWIFNCKQTSRLVSESMDKELPFGRRLGVRFHLMMCRHCARYEQQLHFIRKLISSNTSSGTQSQDINLDENAKNRLRELINEHNTTDD